jgi:hypothetical protein
VLQLSSSHFLNDQTYVYDDPLRVSSGSRHPQFLDDKTHIQDDPLRVSAGSRHPQFLDDQTHIHDDPLRVSAGNRHLKDTNQRFRTRQPYIDRGRSVQM